MSGYSRKHSKTGLYHIMLRGNEIKVIFLDEEDMENISIKKG